MGKEDRMELAIHKMASLGLPEKFVRTVTQNALKIYGNWKFLEADDYLVLADLCFGQLEADSLAIQKGQSMIIYQDSPELKAKVDDNYTPKTRKVKAEPEESTTPTPQSKGKAPAVDNGPVPMDEEDTSCRRKLKQPLVEEEEEETEESLRRAEKAAVVMYDASGPSGSRLRAFLGPGVRKFARNSPFSVSDDEEDDKTVVERSLPESSKAQPSNVMPVVVNQLTGSSNSDALALIANVYPEEEDE